MVENVLNFRDVFSYNPELLLRIIQAVGFNVFDFVHSVFFLFSPFELLVEEVKDHKVETPQIVSSGKVLFMVSITNKLTTLL